MKSTPSRRLAAAAVLALVPAVSSCATNFNAQTDQFYTPADGTNDRDGSVDVLNALIVSDKPGTGRFIAGLSNEDTQQADALTGVAGAGEDADVQYSIGAGETQVPAGGFLQLADPQAAFVSVTGDPKKVAPGGFVRLTVTFKNAEPATVDVPVVEPDTDFADVSLSPAPSPGSGSGSGSPRPSASGSPSPSTSSSPKG